MVVNSTADLLTIPEYGIQVPGLSLSTAYLLLNNSQKVETSEL